MKCWGSSHNVPLNIDLCRRLSTAGQEDIHIGGGMYIDGRFQGCHQRVPRASCCNRDPAPDVFKFLYPRIRHLPRSPVRWHSVWATVHMCLESKATWSTSKAPWVQFWTSWIIHTCIPLIDFSYLTRLPCMLALFTYPILYIQWLATL